MNLTKTCVHLYASLIRLDPANGITVYQCNTCIRRWEEVVELKELRVREEGEKA